MGQLQEASSRLSYGVAILWLENNGGLAGVFLIVNKIIVNVVLEKICVCETIRYNMQDLTSTFEI